MLTTHTYFPEHHPQDPFLDTPLDTEWVSDQAIVQANRRVRAHVRKTPLLRAPRFGGWLKLENLQHTGAYKVRGALNALTEAFERGDRRGVIAASAGNHSSGVAFAAAQLGLDAWAVMPRTTPNAKVVMTRRFGARVILHGHTYEDAHLHALSLAQEHGLRLVPAFDDQQIIAGQASLGVELEAFNPAVVYVPVGGGGLAAGVGLALRRSNARVIGVQVEGVDGMYRAFHGYPPLERAAPTIADGVHVVRPGTLTSAICREVLDAVELVSEEEVRATMLDLFETERVLTEGAGALAAAAMRRNPGERSVAIVSGGNVDLPSLASLRATERSSSSSSLPAPSSSFPSEPYLPHRR